MRVVRLPENFEKHDFKGLSRVESDPKVRVRIIGLGMLQKGQKIKEVSESLEKSSITVASWLKRFKKKWNRRIKR